MKPKTPILILLSFCAALAAETFPVPQLPFAPLRYPCYKTAEAPAIDGRLGDPAWGLAPFSEAFTDIEGELKPVPWLETRVQMLWDQAGLYIGASLEEPQLWATLTQHDAVIFQDNDFEVFIDPNGDTHEYFELEINALGTLWDLFLIRPYRDSHSPLTGWEAAGALCAVGLDGSLNDPSDTDNGWSVEMFLPWKAFEEMAHTACPPRPGDFWRINFSRVQWELESHDGAYAKLPGKPEHNWVWSPQGLIAMHYPERWGYVFFLDTDNDSASLLPPIPESESARDYLRRLYYAQKQHWMDHASYSSQRSELGLPPFVHAGKSCEPLIETTSRGFIARLAAEGFPAYIIQSDGWITEVTP